MNNPLKLALLATLCAANASAAVAGEVKRMKSEDGMYITYRPATGRFCLRTSSDAKAAKLGLKLHATECATKEGWARQGLTVARRADMAQQVASVD